MKRHVVIYWDCTSSEDILDIDDKDIPVLYKFIKLVNSTPAFEYALVGLNIFDIESNKSIIYKEGETK